MSPSNPALSRTSGITFMVMPPTNPSTLSSSTVSFIFDDHIATYGGVADGNYIIAPVTFTIGSTIIQVTGGSFTAGDVGKGISVGQSRFSSPLITTIVSVVNSSKITVATAPSTGSVVDQTHCVSWGTDNASAFAAFVAARSSLSSGTGRLTCSSGVYYISYGNPLFSTVNGLVLNASNTTFAGGTLQFGSSGQAADETVTIYHARTSSATAGNAYVDISPSSHASRFTVGRYALMSGLDLQGGAAYPSNFQYFEYLLISAIDNSSVSPTYGRVSFTTALQNNYLTTWPHYTDADAGGGFPDQGGPATLYLYPSAWGNCDHTYNLGGWAADVPPGAAGRLVAFNNTTFSAGDGYTTYPTQCGSITYTGCNFGSGVIEVDKLNATITANNCTMGQLHFQSASNDLFTGSGNTISGSFFGSPKRVNLSNCTIATFTPGPSNYGAGDSVSLSCSVVAVNGDSVGATWFGPLNAGVNNGGMLMSSGQIAIPSSYFVNGTLDSNGLPLTAWAIPGHYCFWQDGDRTGLGIFKVTSVTSNSSYILVQTDQSSGFPLYDSAVGILKIHTHPCPSWTSTNCAATAPATGNDNSIAWGLSQASSARPLWSYMKMLYNAGATEMGHGNNMWGYVSSMIADVTATYVGGGSNPKCYVTGSLGGGVAPWMTNPASSLPNGPWQPLLAVGSSVGTLTRSISVSPSTGGSATYTGFASGDSGQTLTIGPPSWYANRVSGAMDSSANTGTMTLMFELSLDQGVV